MKGYIQDLYKINWPNSDMEILWGYNYKKVPYFFRLNSFALGDHSKWFIKKYYIEESKKYYIMEGEEECVKPEDKQKIVIIYRR